MFDSFDNSYIRIWHTSMTAGFPPGTLLPHRNLRRATPSCLIRQRGMGGILRSVGVQPAATISSCLTLTSSFRQRKRRPPFRCRTKAKHQHAEIFYDGRSVALTSLLGKCVMQRACQGKKQTKKQTKQLTLSSLITLWNRKKSKLGALMPRGATRLIWRDVVWYFFPPPFLQILNNFN